MSCACDTLVFPPPRSIGAGLTDLPRQLAIFAEWRSVILSGIGREPALAGWRARDADIGLLYVDMASYMLDVAAFYHMVHAHEGLLRTARLPSSTRRLVALIGYRPRPAVAALADLAVTLDGARPLTLPPGTGFRSAAAEGLPPQVFELDRPATIYPLRSRWGLAPVVPASFGVSGGAADVRDYLLFKPGTVVAKAGSPVIVIIGANVTVRHVLSDDEYRGADGKTYRKLRFDAALTIPAGTPNGSVSILVGTASAGLWTRNALTTALSGATLVLDGLQPRIETGAYVLVRREGDARWFKVTATASASPTLMAATTSYLKDKDGHDAGSVAIAAITGVATQITLDATVNARKPAGGTDWTNATAPELRVIYGFIPAGEMVREPNDRVVSGNGFKFAARARDPGIPANRLMVEDADGRGVLVTGQIDYVNGSVALDSGNPWPEAPLTPPLALYGNVVEVSRGETVAGELLGRGDASAERLSFKLRKKPLTYLPGASPGNDWGLTSSLVVHVGSVAWTEVPSFFGVAGDAEVFCVEHDDDENSFVVFGGGARPPTGATIVADYRFGAGVAKPPAGGIHQLAKPVPNLSAVRDPVGSYGGADREAPAQLRTFAPRSALLLGRAISVLDFEAAAASVPGVRAVRAEWRWSHVRQEPLVEVAYIGVASLAPTVLDRLRTLAEPSAPLAAVAATAVPSLLSVQIVVDERRDVPTVVAAVRAALIDGPDAFLAPELLGIGRALFRSRVFEAVLAVPGVLAVRDIRLGGTVMADYGALPGASSYFDFENGGVSVNGVSGHV